jgi:hypothetical protein
MKRYSTGGFGALSLPDDLTSAIDYPPQRNVIPAANIPQLGNGVASPLIVLQDYCGWVYLEADGGADVYIAPSQSGGGFITRLLAGKALWIGDGCFRLYYGTTAPAEGVQVIGCTARDAMILALGPIDDDNAIGPIPGSSGQSIPFANTLPPASNVGVATAQVVAGSAPGLQAFIVFEPYTLAGNNNPDGVNPVFVANTPAAAIAAALAWFTFVTVGGASPAPTGAIPMYPGGNLEWNGVAYMANASYVGYKNVATALMAGYVG